jgi:hypothetical protein
MNNSIAERMRSGGGRAALDSRYTDNLPVASCDFGKDDALNLQAEIIIYDCGVAPGQSSPHLLILPPSAFDQGGVQMAMDNTVIPVNSSASLAAIANKRGAMAYTLTGNIQKDPLSVVIAELESGREATDVPGVDGAKEVVHGDQGGVAKKTYGILLLAFTYEMGKRKVRNTYWSPRTEVMLGAQKTFGISQTNTITPFTFSAMPYNEAGERVIERIYT